MHLIDFKVFRNPKCPDILASWARCNTSLALRLGMQSFPSYRNRFRFNWNYSNNVVTRFLCTVSNGSSPCNPRIIGPNVWSLSYSLAKFRYMFMEQVFILFIPIILDSKACRIRDRASHKTWMRPSLRFILNIPNWDSKSNHLPSFRNMFRLFKEVVQHLIICQHFKARTS